MKIIKPDNQQGVKNTLNFFEDNLNSDVVYSSLVDPSFLLWFTDDNDNYFVLTDNNGLCVFSDHSDCSNFLSNYHESAALVLKPTTLKATLTIS